MNDKHLYTEDSIESLSPLEFTRLRPQVYAGDCTYSTQLLVEIISNAVDEYRLGHGNKIDVTINKDIVSVQDYGQGFIPNSFREDGKTILEAAFSVLNTSGKYRDDGTYEGTSLGSFGIGSKITTFLSHWLNVETYRNTEAERVCFVEGIFKDRNTYYSTKNQPINGTFVQWQPSEEFFTHTEVEINKIRDLFKTIVCLCPGLTINLNNNGKIEIFTSTHGINDLVDEAVKDTELINNRFSMNFSEGKNKLDMVLTYAGNYSVFNITAPNVGYDAQVKSRITKIDMTPFTSALSTNLEVWLNNNEKEVKSIFEKAAAARKARDAAKKARDKAREQNKKKQKALKFDSKLADCNSKDRSKCEIYITEGDSASGNLKLARDNETQAVMPVRGKILNTQKATFAQIQKNAEIMTMCDAFFGPGDWSIDPKTLKVTYHQVRYGKIIIMSDADVDGAHIKNLFYTFIWNFCPDLIKDGYVYAGVPPLYKITLAANKGYKYLKNDEALAEYQKENKEKKYQVGRMKGLGEMDVEETEETLTDPNNRIIKQISVEDVAAADKLFNDLMGNAVIPRKRYIKEHSQEATYNAE